MSFLASSVRLVPLYYILIVDNSKSASMLLNGLHFHSMIIKASIDFISGIWTLIIQTFWILCGWLPLRFCPLGMVI